MLFQEIIMVHPSVIDALKSAYYFNDDWGMMKMMMMMMIVLICIDKKIWKQSDYLYYI
jgi:hypothetical protein